MKMCHEAKKILKMVDEKNWLGVLADLIEDESEDMQKYVWLSEMADGNEELTEIFKNLAYEENEHAVKFLHAVFVDMAKKHAQVHGEPTIEEKAMWTMEHNKLMEEHDEAYEKLEVKNIFEIEYDKILFFYEHCKNDKEALMYRKLLDYLKPMISEYNLMKGA